MRLEESRRRRACVQEEIAEAVQKDVYATVHKLAHALADKCRGP